MRLCSEASGFACAKTYHGRVGPMELNIPGIRGIGGSLIYLVDRFGDRSIYDVDFAPAAKHCEKFMAWG
jgi:4-hydroxyphenylpyruvate dioxygenase-like putative hemolysin